MLFSLKMLQSSLYWEFIPFAGATPICIDRHLPRRFEHRLRTEALPLLDVERVVHFGIRPYRSITNTGRGFSQTHVHGSLVQLEYVGPSHISGEGEANAPLRTCEEIYRPPINADERRWKTARGLLSAFIGVHRRPMFFLGWPRIVKSGSWSRASLSGHSVAAFQGTGKCRA
jgi:hypothetical protein